MVLKIYVLKDTNTVRLFVKTASDSEI